MTAPTREVASEEAGPKGFFIVGGVVREQHALVTGASVGMPVAVPVRGVENPPESDDPNFIDTWRDEETLSGLSDHIDRVVEDWQGDRP